MCVGAGFGDNIWAYTPYGMSGKERQRILREEAVRMEARRMGPELAGLEASRYIPEEHSGNDRNRIHFIGENWGEMPGESQADQQAKALGAMILLDASRLSFVIDEEVPVGRYRLFVGSRAKGQAAVATDSIPVEIVAEPHGD